VSTQNNSNYSTYVTITAPATPTGLVATPSSPTQVNYSWNTAARAVSYNIQRATNSGFTANVVTVNQAGLTGSSTGLSPGTIYYYRVQSVNAAGMSSYTTPAVSATTILPAPTGVSVTGLTATTAAPPAYTGAATVNWSAAAGAVTYRLEYATNSGFTGATSISGIATTSRTITGLYQQQVYYFRVFTVGSTMESSASATASGTTPFAQPPVPSSGITYFSPAIYNWANNQHVVVNWATYCPTNPVTPISVSNANFTATDWPPAPINSYYHGFGFSDWWSTSYNDAPVTYYARYYCTNANGTSGASPDSVTGVIIN
jgi:predicted phage tail protein